MNGLSVQQIEDNISEVMKPGSKEAKIIELAKKARRLTVAYEREKAANASLLTRIKVRLYDDYYCVSTSPTYCHVHKLMGD